MNKKDEKILAEFQKRLQIAKELFPPRSPFPWENAAQAVETVQVTYGSPEDDSRSHERLKRLFGELPPDDDPDSWSLPGC